MFARDKKKHFWAGLALAIIAGVFLCPILARVPWRFAQLLVALGASGLGLLTAAVGGAVKEIIRDWLLKRGHPEWLDFLATCLGGAIGSLILKILGVG